MEPPPAKKRAFSAKKYVFTLHDPAAKMSPETLIALLKHLGARYLNFSEEAAPTTGKRHWQGFVHFANSVKRDALNDVFAGHWDKQHGSDAENLSYTTKEHTHVAGPYKFGHLAGDDGAWITGFEGAVVQPWQAKILELLDTPPDRRSVHWYYSHEGATGKTSFCKHLAKTRGAWFIKAVDETHQMVAQFALYMDPAAVGAKKGEPEELGPCVIIDIPRGQKIPYAFIEMLLDGWMVNTKYHPLRMKYNCPHVLCFSNEEPSMHDHLLGRWKVTQVCGLVPLAQVALD